jgi:hypothetical protein
MQEAVLEALGVSGKFDVMFIELPYIFGTMEGRKPLWGEAFLDRIETKNGIFFPSGGGTAAIDVRNVARAIVGAAFYGENHGKYAIGDECILFKDMLDVMLEAKGSKSKVKEVPPILAAIGAYFIGRKERKAGKKSGLNHFWLMLQIQNKHFFIEPKKYQEILHFKELGYIEDFDVVESIKKTIKICYQK